MSRSFRSTPSRGPVLLLVLALFLLAPSVANAANVVPPNFDDSQIATATNVTDIAFTPDGRLLVLHQRGPQQGIMSILREDGTLLNATALDLSGATCSNMDRGVQSVVADPSFGANHYIYIYYTSNKERQLHRQQSQRRGESCVPVRAQR